MRINKHDTQGTKPLLSKGELGYDDYAAGGDVGRVYVGTGSENIALAEKSEIDSHVNRVDNPHNVTKAQVGLGNVDNTADVNKNVLSATKWTTARTITLSGDVAGSVSMDGTANVSITTTVQPNSVALGTDTTGNYVAGATAGTGISVTGTAGEGWSPTIAIDSTVATLTGAQTLTNKTLQDSTTFIVDNTDATKKVQFDVAGVTTATTRTLTVPNVNGTIITTGDTGTVTSTMIADGTIVDTDINASAAIVDTKLATISTAGKVSNSATTATNLNTASAIVARDASGNFSAGTITASLSGNSSTATALATGRTIGMTGDVTWTSASFDGTGNVTGAATLSNSGVTSGSYSKVTVDAKGRVTAGLTPTMEDIPDATFKRSVRVATTANIILSATQTIDDIVLAVGDRVLVKDQTAQAENGIYVVSSTAWTRSLDADTASKIASALVAVDSGTVNGGKLFDNDFKTTDTLGTTAMLWASNLDSGHLSSSIPIVAGTGSAGTAVTISRSDHVHPAQTTITGNAGTATALQTGRTIGMTGDVTYTSGSFNGSANVTGTATLATVTDSGTGTFKKITVDTKGRVTGTAAVAQSDITGLLGAGSITNTMLANSAVANLSGTNTGDETTATIKTKLGISTLSGSNTGDQTITLTGDVTGTGTGSFATTLADSGVTAGTYSKVTVDSKGRITVGSAMTMEDIPSASFKKSVAVATTANITLSGTQTIDGVAVVAGDRVLVKNQTTASQNGIYVVTASAWTRATDSDTSDEIASAIVNVDKGTTNGGQAFTNTFKVTDTLDTTTMSWYKIVYENGTWGISVTGNAGTATTLKTARTLQTDLGTTTAGSFNGSANITLGVTGTLPVANGGTGTTTLTGLVKGNGTSAMTAAVAGTDYVIPSGSITGNAATATQLATARTISLTGDVTGSLSFDGSANASMTATIAANSVALGTDTTGNYVAGATAGTGISISGTAGEGWSPTIALATAGTAGTYTKVTTDAYGRVTTGTNPTTLSGYGITDAYTKTEIGTVNLFRADKFLAAQNIANMIYTNGDLTKIRYNNDTDSNYEVLNYVNGNLSTINHYTGGVLRGTTTLSYTNGNLVSAVFA